MPVLKFPHAAALRAAVLLLCTVSLATSRAAPTHGGDFIAATLKMNCNDFASCTTLATKYYQYVGAFDAAGNPNGGSFYGSFAQWRAHHFPPNAVPAEDRADYYNHGDLGIGRDMHCRTYHRPLSPNVPELWTLACYVSNYTDGVAGHDFSNSAPGPAIANAIAGGSDPHNLFATVAMEVDWLEGLQGFGTGPEVKFLAFNSAGQPVQNVRLDTSKPSPGNVQAVPGTCMVCHGGHSPQGLNTRIDASGGRVLVQDAKFLPFDTLQFRYGDGTRTTPTPGEEEALRRLNKQVRDFYAPWTPHAIKDLIDAWYAKCGGVGAPNCAQDTTFVPAGTCVGDQPSAGRWETCGWTTGAPLFAARKPGFDIKAFYLGVPGRYCRTCHLAAPERFNVQSAQEWSIFSTVVNSDVRVSATMPDAKATFDNYWNDAAAQTLLSQYLDDVDVLTQKQTACIAACAAKQSTCLQLANDLDGRDRIRARAACIRTDQTCIAGCRRNP